jgi:DNA-binding XRE family transcriptional regulator
LEPPADPTGFVFPAAFCWLPADNAQWSGWSYRGWERNQRNPSFRYMPRIVQFLGYIPFDTELENLGQKIRAYRQFMGLRQKDLARLLGVNPNTIGHWEKGKHKPERRLFKELVAFSSSTIHSPTQLKHQNL